MSAARATPVINSAATAAAHPLRAIVEKAIFALPGPPSSPAGHDLVNTTKKADAANLGRPRACPLNGKTRGRTGAFLVIVSVFAGCPPKSGAC
jgi:hypothetical protein